MDKPIGKISNFSAFTLIEAMVVVFIVSLIAVSFYSVFSIGTRHIVASKNRLEASALANEKMEIVRNLDYENIGTKKDDGSGGYVYGIPAGDILQYEEVVRGSRDFYVYSTVKYVDDSYDGTEDGSPDDEIANDYKMVSVRVFWNPDQDSSDFVSLTSNFSPQGIEKLEDGGTLSVNVINNQGLGIPEANVRIINSDESVDFSALTDSSGNVSFPGAPPGDQNYHVEVSKTGYYAVNTYPPYPDSSFNPTDVHASVVEGKLNMKSLLTDELSDLSINSVDAFGQSVPDVHFDIKGGKKIGDTLAEIPESVFDFELADVTTGSSGEKTFSGRSFGIYYFTPASLSGYTFLKLDNDQEKLDELNLLPGTDLDVNAIYAKNDISSLLVKVATSVDGENIYIAGAEVELRDDSSGYSATLLTDRYGLAFFPESLPELEAGSYSLTVRASGYQDKSDSVDINEFTQKEIILETS